MTYIPVNQPRSAHWLISGKFLAEGLLEGTMETKDANGTPIVQKIRFEHQSKDHFVWNADWSYDEGKTWIKGVGHAECQRIGGLGQAPKGTAW